MDNHYNVNRVNTVDARHNMSHVTVKNHLSQISTWPDKVLYKICKRWGAEALEARRKFAGLLPEVFRRRLYEKRGFESIYHFAAKLAGMNHEQVATVLRLEKRFVDKPVLRAALTEGKISATKLARIASIATAKNEAHLAGKIELLSQRAVDVFVRDFKREYNQTYANEEKKLRGNKNVNGLLEASKAHNSLCAQTFPDASISSVKTGTVRLTLDTDVEKQLWELQEKGVDINAFLREALQKRPQEIETKKDELSREQRQKRYDRAVIGKPASRYIPAKIVKIIRAEFGSKCSAPGCQNRAENLHHMRGFAADRCHDPRFLKPLCEAHHELVHATDLKVQKYRRSNPWLSYTTSFASHLA